MSSSLEITMLTVYKVLSLLSLRRKKKTLPSSGGWSIPTESGKVLRPFCAMLVYISVNPLTTNSERQYVDNFDMVDCSLSTIVIL